MIAAGAAFIRPSSKQSIVYSYTEPRDHVNGLVRTKIHHLIELEPGWKFDRRGRVPLDRFGAPIEKQ